MLWHCLRQCGEHDVRCAQTGLEWVRLDGRLEECDTGRPIRNRMERIIRWIDQWIAQSLDSFDSQSSASIVIVIWISIRLEFWHTYTLSSDILSKLLFSLLIKTSFAVNWMLETKCFYRRKTQIKTQYLYYWLFFAMKELSKPLKPLKPLSRCFERKIISISCHYSFRAQKISIFECLL